MARIFINYRRRDDAYAAAFLDDSLSRSFGRDEIFRAGRSIPAGADYERSIKAAVDTCLAMLVIIGPEWSESFVEETPVVDWVSFEIARGLAREIPVVPILLSGTVRLQADRLPAGVQAIAKLQYLRFDYRNAEQDLAHIAAELCKVVPTLDGDGQSW